MRKNYLITGGAGFIGYHISKFLLDARHNVICVDNLNNYYSEKLKKDRLKELSKYRNFKFFKLDISNKTILYKKLSKIKINKIIHLAAQAGVRYAYKYPRKYFQSNLKGFFNIIEFAREKKIKELLCASTSSIYGEQEKFPIKETFDSSKPIQFYAATKKANEVMGYSYYKMFKINFVFMRFFTVYGPWGRPDLSIFKFVKNIKNGKKIQIYNFGDHVRDFTYIDDVVSGISKILKRRNKGVNIFNIGSTKKIKLMDVVKKIEFLLNKKAKIEYLSMQPGDIYKTHSDTSFLYRYCGYKSKTSINTGLKKFINWYNNYYK